MKKIVTVIFAILLTASTVALGYYGHRLWVFSGKVSKAFEYTYAAIDCLIQENGQAESDIDILFKGFKSRKAYYEAVNKEYPGLYSKEQIKKNSTRDVYNGQIPECKKFYSEYRCWELDPHSNGSLDGCGERFGYTKEDIAKAKELNDKNDYEGANKVAQEVWDRKAKESK